MPYGLVLVVQSALCAHNCHQATNAHGSPIPNALRLSPHGSCCCRYAFAIWGLIFALQGAGVVYQVLPSGYRAGGWKTNVVNRIGR